MLGLARSFEGFATEYEPEGSEGSEDFLAVPTSFSLFVVILFELLSKISSNILRTSQISSVLILQLQYQTRRTSPC